MNVTEFRRITFKRHPVATHRRHYVGEDDVRVVLSRLPESLLSRLKEVHFSDDAWGNRTLGYTSRRGRRHVSLCALPIRVSLNRARDAYPAEKYGALKNSQWPVLAVRRYTLYYTLLHEIGHLQVVRTGSRRPERTFASETLADEFAVRWRTKLWAEPFPHPDPVHNAPGEGELRALKRGWATGHLSYRRGLDLEDAGKKREAMKWYEKALGLYSDHALALERLGVLNYAFSDETGPPALERAVDLCRRALAQDPMLCGAAIYLAMALFRLDQAGPSREMFGRAIDIDPYRDLAKTVFAEHLGYWGEYDAAERLFEKILQKEPPIPMALRYYAHLLMYRSDEVDEDDLRRAIQLLEKAVEADSGLAIELHSQYDLAIAHSWLGHLDKAIRHMREVIRIKPGHKDAANWLEEWQSESM